MVGRGYFFYVQGEIPAGKDPLLVDAKIGTRYGVTRSKTKRNRRKHAGLANVLYARLGRFFVVAATRGESPFFVEESKRLRDVREAPIKFAGYSIGYRRGQGAWHPSVRIEQDRYRELKAHFLEIAPHWSIESLVDEFRRRADFEPYAPVRAQLFSILRGVNRARVAAGREPISGVPMRLKRKTSNPRENAEREVPFDQVLEADGPELGVLKLRVHDEPRSRRLNSGKADHVRSGGVIDDDDDTR